MMYASLLLQQKYLMLYWIFQLLLLHTINKLQKSKIYWFELKMKHNYGHNKDKDLWNNVLCSGVVVKLIKTFS